MDKTIYPGTRLERLPQALKPAALLARHVVRSVRGLAAGGLSPEQVVERDIKREAGYWHAYDLTRLTAMAANVPGEFIEMGVWRGNATSKLIPLAAAQGKRVHAVDSFQGMAPPGEFDTYVEGQLSVGGPEAFQKLMLDRGIPAQQYDIWPGYIPDVLAKLPESLAFSFAIIDVDNYQPTVDAVAWLWPRLNRGGIVALDDFAYDYEMECSRAVNEFLRGAPGAEVVSNVNRQIAVRKL